MKRQRSETRYNPIPHPALDTKMGWNTYNLDGITEEQQE